MLRIFGGLRFLRFGFDAEAVDVEILGDLPNTAHDEGHVCGRGDGENDERDAPLWHPLLLFV